MSGKMMRDIRACTEFLDYLAERGFVICEFYNDRYLPVEVLGKKILKEHFGVENE